MGQLISYYYISEKLEHNTLKSNMIVVRRTMAQNRWNGMMQGEGMLDKIGKVH